MQTERVTYLTNPLGRAKLASKASAQGVSMSEYVRRKVEDDEDDLTPGQEAELAAIIRQVNEAVPKMQASIDSMIATMEKGHRETDAFLRQMGIR